MTPRNCQQVRFQLLSLASFVGQSRVTRGYKRIGPLRFHCVWFCIFGSSCHVFRLVDLRQFVILLPHTHTHGCAVKFAAHRLLQSCPRSTLMLMCRSVSINVSFPPIKGFQSDLRKTVSERTPSFRQVWGRLRRGFLGKHVLGLRYHLSFLMTFWFVWTSTASPCPWCFLLTTPILQSSYTDDSFWAPFPSDLFEHFLQVSPKFSGKWFLGAGYEVPFQGA